MFNSLLFTHRLIFVVDFTNMDMSQEQLNNPSENHEALLSIKPKNTDFEAFEKLHAGKDAEALTVALKGLQDELDAQIRSAPDINIYDLGLDGGTFVDETEGLHKEAVIEAKIKIIKKLIDAEKKYAIH